MRSIFKSDERPIDWHWLVQLFLFIGFVIGVPFGIGTAGKIFRDGDVSWHIAAGNWILSHGRIPTTDPFSFTAAGHPWVAMEWLAEVTYATAFNMAGYAGLTTIVAAALIGLNAIIFFFLERRASPLVLGLTMLTTNIGLAPFVLARPHVLAWPLLAGWTVLLLSYAEQRRPPPLWAALILIVWTNLHASFPLAVPIAGAIALDSLVETGWKTLRQWLVFALVSAAAIMLNANGIAGLIQPFHTSSLDMLPVIGEWQPSTTHNAPQFFIILLFGISALLWRGIRVPIGRLILLPATLGMAFMHFRHQSSFIILAACIIPPLFASKAAAKVVPKLLLLIAVPLLTARALVPMTPPETQANPRHLLAAIPAELKSQPVFNGYSFGGPLILAGIRPYIDGRGEIYGDEFVLDYVKITEGDIDRFDRAVKRYDIRWTMLPVSSERLIRELESSGKWQRIYADRVGVIDVRK
jgi:hypothetical protein